MSFTNRSDVKKMIKTEMNCQASCKTSGTLCQRRVTQRNESVPGARGKREGQKILVSPDLGQGDTVEYRSHERATLTGGGMEF